MKLDDLEMELRNLKFQHLTEEELVSCYEERLDEVGQARALAHLKLCLICDRRLTLLKEETRAIETPDGTAGDVALARRMIQQTKPHQLFSNSMSPQASAELRLSERLGECFRQAVASWQAHFTLQVMRGTRSAGKEVWRWQSEDGLLEAHAILEKNADLTIHFSSNEPGLEGVRLNVSLGPLSRKTTLRRVSESEVYGIVKVTKRQRPENLAEISIETL
jgi:hypothetical protein